MRETGCSTTTEDEHSHYCWVCGGIWKHSDESCDIERYKSLSVTTGDCLCPMCEDTWEPRS